MADCDMSLLKLLIPPKNRIDKITNYDHIYGINTIYSDYNDDISIANKELSFDKESEEPFIYCPKCGVKLIE